MIRLAAASLSFDGFDDLDFARTFALAPHVGFRNLELNCWYPQNITALGVRSVRRRCYEAGLTPVSLHFTGPTGVDHKDQIKDLALAMRGIDMAKELGCDLFCTLGAVRTQPGSTRALTVMLERLVPYAEEVGIAIAIENHDGHAIQTIDDYDALFAEIDSPNLGVCADVGHFHAAGVANDDIASRLGDRIVHIHVKDNLVFGSKRFVPFGEGTADNPGFVRTLADRGYRGSIVVELSPGSLDFADRSSHLAALRTAFEMFAPFEKE